MREDTGSAAGVPADVPVRCLGGSLNQDKCRWHPSGPKAGRACGRLRAISSHLRHQDLFLKTSTFQTLKSVCSAFRGHASRPRVCRLPKLSVRLAPWHGPACWRSRARGQQLAAGLSGVWWVSELIDSPWRSFWWRQQGGPVLLCFPIMSAGLLSWGRGARPTYLGWGPHGLRLCLGHRSLAGLLPSGSLT